MPDSDVALFGDGFGRSCRTLGEHAVSADIGSEKCSRVCPLIVKAST